MPVDRGERPLTAKSPLEQLDDFRAKYGARVWSDGTLKPACGSQVVLWGLVAANVLVFLVWQLADAVPFVGWLMENNFTVSFDAVYHLRVWTLVTSAFSHYSTTHILFNMLALVMFGRDVAGVLGPWRFLHLYLVGAIAASLGHLLWQVLSGSLDPALGASGSVMAISIVFAALFPRRRMVLFVVPMPAALAAAVYVLIDLCGAIGSTDGVAHAAHLGGAAYGAVYGVLCGRRVLQRVIARGPVHVAR